MLLPREIIPNERSERLVNRRGRTVNESSGEPAFSNASFHGCFENISPIVLHSAPPRTDYFNICPLIFVYSLFFIFSFFFSSPKNRSKCVHRSNSNEISALFVQFARQYTGRIMQFCLLNCFRDQRTDQRCSCIVKNVWTIVMLHR